jgi:hypothetical protein
MSHIGMSYWPDIKSMVVLVKCNLLDLSIDFEKERTGHYGDIFLVLHVDHIMTNYKNVIYRYHLHRQLSKEIVKIGRSIQKLQAS